MASDGPLTWGWPRDRPSPFVFPSARWLGIFLVRIGKGSTSISRTTGISFWSKKSLNHPTCVRGFEDGAGGVRELKVYHLGNSNPVRVREAKCSTLWQSDSHGSRSQKLLDCC